jgi:hypothetical protein
MRHSRLINTDIVNDANSMAEAISTTPLNSFPDAREPESFTSVDSEMRVLSSQVLECIQVSSGWKSRLSPGNIETDNASVSVLHDKFSYLPTLCSRAHSCQQCANANRSAQLRGVPLSLPKARQDCLNHLVQIKPLLHVQLGSKSNLCVHHTIGSKVKRTFEGNACQRSRVLSDTHGMREGL